MTPKEVRRAARYIANRETPPEAATWVRDVAITLRLDAKAQSAEKRAKLAEHWGLKPFRDQTGEKAVTERSIEPGIPALTGHKDDRRSERDHLDMVEFYRMEYEAGHDPITGRQLKGNALEESGRSNQAGGGPGELTERGTAAGSAENYAMLLDALKLFGENDE